MTQFPTTNLPNTQRGQKALIYCRVSSLKQTIDGSGLDSQEHRCRRYAEQHGYVVEKVFTDDVSGGGDFLKRKGMVALLEYLRRRRTTDYVVIFDDLKRFARDTLFHLQLRAQMDRYNARIECLNFRFEDTPEGKFVEIIHAAQGQLEREQNGRQTVQKMCARLEQGYFVFHAPIGYRYEKVGHHGKLLVLNEPYASVIKEALEGFASGRFQTQAEMRRYLEGCECIPKNAKGQIAKKRTADLLKHPAYAGYVEHERWGISFRKGQHEPLISLETYRKNQERLNGKPLVPTRKDLNKEFPLRGFVVCGDCGHPYTASFTKGKTKYHPYYVCQQRRCDSYGKSIRRADLEGAFETVLKHMTPSKEVFALAMAMLKDQWNKREEIQSTQEKEHQKTLAEIEQKIEKVIDMMIDANSDIVRQNLTKRLAQLEKEKLITEGQINATAQPLRSLESIARTSLDFLANPRKLWESERLEDKRAVLKLAFAEPWAYHRNEGARTPNFSLPFKALDEISPPQNEMVPSWKIEPDMIEEQLSASDDEVIKVLLPEVLRNQRALKVPQSNVVFGHFDLHGGNVLFDKEHAHVTGVIDFSNCKLGDLHQDLSTMHLSSPDLTVRIIEKYEKLTDKNVNRLLVQHYTTIFYLNLLASLKRNKTEDKFNYWLGELHHWFDHLINERASVKLRDYKVVTNIPPNWRKWIASNLIKGGSPLGVQKVLLEQGYSFIDIATEIQLATDHPYVQAGQEISHTLKKRNWLLKTCDTLAALDQRYSTQIQVIETPRFEIFVRDYYSKHFPVVLTNGIQHWEALEKWNSNYLLERFGEKEIEVQFDRDKDPLFERNSGKHKKRILMRDFVDLVNCGGDSNNYYMTANNTKNSLNSIESLFDDLGDFGEGYRKQDDLKASTFFWFGPKGTFTPIHHDLTNNMLVQIMGRKKVILIPAWQVPWLYNDKGVFSAADFPSFDDKRHPLMKNITPVEVVIGPGDALFIPIGWWHCVESLDVSISISFTDFNAPNQFSTEFPRG